MTICVTHALSLAWVSNFQEICFLNEGSEVNQDDKLRFAQLLGKCSGGDLGAEDFKQLKDIMIKCEKDVPQYCSLAGARISGREGAIEGLEEYFRNDSSHIRPMAKM